ncbi:MAG: hypothetical protein OS130_02420 [Thermodesulfobacteriota bacterium]|jgi:20S proteasome alpha/beta subunit|nr:MAG: hypothetical protein OS130_02420 [Thermodesulfobacteriota bacterium]
MTLIIAAICRDGVLIRSDKRRKVMNSSGEIIYYDDMDKVFVSADKRTIIYNHGINVIKGKSWYDLAIRAENAIRKESADDIDTALNKVENTISAEVLAEISNNQLDDFCAFVVILKTSGNQWQAKDISWKRGEGVKKTPLGRIILSGSGEKYIKRDKKWWNNNYWASLSMDEAKGQIERLYSMAIKNQNNAQGDEFSSSFNDVMVT